MIIDARRPFTEGQRDKAIPDLCANKDFDPNQKVLVVSDVDSTFIKQEVIDLLAEKAGRKEEVSIITESAMRGEIDFATSLRKRVSTLAGIKLSDLEEVKNQIELTPGAEATVLELQKRGHEFALVSGGFTQILEPLCNRLNISHFLANNLEIIEGKLTGNLLGEIVDGKGKALYLQELASKLNIKSANIIAIGDGANDIEMMDSANIAISFNGKPRVKEISDVHLEGEYFDHLLQFII